MSRSILKSSDPSKRVVPIAASEGDSRETNDFGHNTTMMPWGPADDPDELITRNLNEEIESIRTNIQNMHHNMMNNFPEPPPFPAPTIPFDPMLPPPPPPAPLALPAPFPFPGTPDFTPKSLTPSPGNQMSQALEPLPAPSLHHHQGGFDNMLMPPGPLMPPMPMTPPLTPPGPSPIITVDDNGFKILELVLDFKGYMPEDIIINTKGNVLYIHACRMVNKHDVGARGTVQDARVMKECRRKYTLQEVVRAENLRCYVNEKGQLTIEGPLGSEVIGTYRKKKVKFAGGKM